MTAPAAYDMARQLVFDLPVRAALGRGDFYVAPSNAMAVAMIDAAPNWPTQQLILTGPAGSGKTHLAQVWSDTSGAPVIAATDMAAQDIPALASAPCIVEDVPLIASDDKALTALFHLYNLSRAEGLPLLMTGREAPRRWNLALPDLQSRIDSVFQVEMSPPNDTLLAAVLGKLFADRQITPKHNVIPFLLRHTERSFAAANEIVARLDQLSLEEGRTISRSLAARLVGDTDEKA